MTVLFFRHTNGSWIVAAYSNTSLEQVARRVFLYEEQAEEFKANLIKEYK